MPAGQNLALKFQLVLKATIPVDITLLAWDLLPPLILSIATVMWNKIIY